jgi:hypothetical protein
VVALTAVLASACSSAASSTSSASAPATASGSVTCSTVTGSLAFSPPLTATGAGAGAGAETGTIRLHASGCATSGSDVSAVGSGTAAVSLSSPTSTCSGVLTLRSVALTIHWMPSTVTPSVLAFSGYSIASRPTGNGGFSFPDPGGTAKVTGSFAGSDGGASSTAAIYFDPSVAQLQSVCRSSGLSSIPVTSGTVTLR